MPRHTLLDRIFLLCLATVALAVGLAMPAMGGTYDVVSCSANSLAAPPTPLSGADDAWTFDATDPGRLMS